MSLHPIGVPRIEIPGANAPPTFRGEQPAVPAPGPSAEPTPPPQPEKIDVLREAAAAAAAERKAKAAERAARIRERERDLAAREERVRQVEARLRAYQSPGGPALALHDLEDAGIPFERLAEVAANGGTVTPEQQALAELRQELEGVKSGLTRAEREREARERADAEATRAAEADAKDGFMRDLANTAQREPERWNLINHFGDRAIGYLWQTAEQMFERTGVEPDPAQVLDAAEHAIAQEIEGAAAARAGRRVSQARSTPAGQQRRVGGEDEAARRARFLGQLDRILWNVR